MRGEESETVAAAITLGFSTITTVHAEDAERCIQRITNPPMRFTSGHVRDITSIATMRKVVLPDGRIVRRVVSIDEVRPQGKDGADILNIFSYHHSTDSFSPTTPEEVLERSFRLKQIAASFGWTSEDVLRSLTNRAGHLESAITNGEFSADELSSVVTRYLSKESRREHERSAN